MTSAARVHLESLLAELRTAAASLPSSIPSTPLRHHSFLLLLRDSSDPLPPSALHEILVRIWPASIPPTDVTRGEAGVALVVDALRRSIATIGAGSERVDVVMLENWVLKFQVAVGKAITNAAPPTLKAEPGSPATCPLSEASRKRPIDNVDGPSAPHLKTRLFALDNFEYYPAKHVPPLEFFITAINNPSDRTKDTFWLHSDRKGGLAAHRVVLDPTMFSCVSYPTDVNSDEPVISFDFYPNPADSTACLSRGEPNRDT
ncbi:hypothetical protein MNV49_002960 [Pseudohyphozyma bogoriensis]|nr:hypothetical protein MNV49_002960 [Pseudohyphozyma bogoriensis]